MDLKNLTKQALLPALVALAVAISIAGCGSSSKTAFSSSGGVTQTASAASSNTVDATLNEWSIDTKSPIVNSGKVTFAATNTGKATHELVVLKTDKPAGSLGGGGRVSEKDSVGEVSDVKPGTTGKSTIDLKPGKYVLICNLPGHYMQGMRTSLTVK